MHRTFKQIAPVYGNRWQLKIIIALGGLIASLKKQTDHAHRRIAEYNSCVRAPLAHLNYHATSRKPGVTLGTTLHNPTRHNEYRSRPE